MLPGQHPLRVDAVALVGHQHAHPRVLAVCLRRRTAAPGCGPSAGDSAAACPRRGAPCEQAGSRRAGPCRRRGSGRACRDRRWRAPGSRCALRSGRTRPPARVLSPARRTRGCALRHEPYPPAPARTLRTRARRRPDGTSSSARASPSRSAAESKLCECGATGLTVSASSGALRDGVQHDALAAVPADPVARSGTRGSGRRRPRRGSSRRRRRSSSSASSRRSGSAPPTSR